MGEGDQLYSFGGRSIRFSPRGGGSSARSMFPRMSSWSRLSASAAVSVSFACLETLLAERFRFLRTSKHSKSLIIMIAGAAAQHKKERQQPLLWW